MKFKTILQLAGVFIVVVACLNQMHHLVNSDEGVVLNGAWKMLSGESMYTDFFEYIPPGAFYFIFIAFKIFGAHYFAAKFLSFLLLLSSAYFLYKSARKIIVDPDLSFLVSSLWLLLASFHPIINHNVFSSAVTLVLMYFFLVFLENRNKKYLLYVGVLSAVVGLFLQTKGLAVFLAVTTYLVWKFRKESLAFLPWYALGIGLVLGPAFLIWGDNLYSNLLLVKGVYTGVHSSFGISLAFFLVLFITIWAKKTLLRREVDFLVLLQGFLLLSILNLPDTAHVLVVSAPSILLLVILIRDYYNKCNKKYIFNTCILVSLAFVSYASFYVYGLPHRSIDKYLTELKNEVGTDDIYIRPFMPGLYFELGKENHYYSSTFETELASRGLLEKDLLLLKEKKPSIVFTNYNMVRKYNYQFNEIDDYITANYYLEKDWGSVSQLRIKK